MIKKILLTPLFIIAMFSQTFAGDITIKHLTIMAKGGVMTGGYGNITNNSNTNDTLIGIKTNFAKKNEIHRTIHKNGKTSMQPIKSLPLPVNKNIKFSRGSYHLMFMGLKQKIIVGKKYKVIFVFKNAGEITAYAIGKKIGGHSH